MMLMPLLLVLSARAATSLCRSAYILGGAVRPLLSFLRFRISG